VSLLLIGIIVISALGVADGLYLLNLKVESEATGNAASRVCEAINENGCSVALESPVSSIGPVPLSLIGIATYLVIIFLAVRWWRHRSSSTAQPDYPYEGAAITAIGLGAVCLSFALALYSAYVSSWCIFCIGLYAVNLAIVALVSRALKQNPLKSIGPTLRTLLTHRSKLGLTIILFAAFIAVGQMILERRVEAYAGERLKSDRSRIEKALKLGTFDVNLESLPIAGPKNAPITVVKLSDFECPFCKKMWTGLENYRKRNPDQVRIAFIHSPLDESCNPMMRPFHEQACEAAYAAQCAHEQGKFFEMADQLFEEQPEFESSNLERIATSVGLDMDIWKKCFTSQRVRAIVEEQALFSRAVGAAGTPSSLLLLPGESKGVMLMGGFGPASLKTFIKELPERTNEAPPPESPLVLARQAAQTSKGDAPELTRLLVDTPEGDSTLNVIIAVDPTDAAGREQVDAAWKIAAYFRHVARVQLSANPQADCSTPSDSACRPSAILACGTRLEDHKDRFAVLDTLIEAQTADLTTLEEQLRSNYAELDKCLQSPSAVLKEDQRSLPEKFRISERPHIWIDGMYFDGPLNQQEINSHIASILLSKRKSPQNKVP
jgi:protein-disulfide isomerase/uncharacterized membrane protein